MTDNRLSTRIGLAIDTIQKAHRSHAMISLEVLQDWCKDAHELEEETRDLICELKEEYPE